MKHAYLGNQKVHIRCCNARNKPLEACGQADVKPLWNQEIDHLRSSILSQSPNIQRKSALGTEFSDKSMEWHGTARVGKGGAQSKLEISKDQRKFRDDLERIDIDVLHIPEWNAWPGGIPERSRASPCPP